MRDDRDLPAAGLGINQLLQTILVSILVLPGFKRGCQTFDELLSERPLLFFNLSLVGMTVFSGRTNLVVIKHGVKREAMLARTNDHDVFAIVHGDFRDARVSGFLHSFH